MAWSTDVVPERERFDFWREAFRAAFGARIERYPDAAAPFSGTIESWATAGVHGYRQRSGAHAVLRTRGEVARRPWDAFLVFRAVEDPARFEYAGREVVSGAGDLLIADLSLPFTAATAATRYACDVWLLPRALLAPRLGTSPRPSSLRLASRHGLGALLSTYLDALTAQLPGLGDASAAGAIEHLCGLVALACTEAHPEAIEGGREALRAAALERVRQYVDRHLADFDLSPERVAKAVGLSLRQLHRVFEPAGETFARYVTRRRLETCRAALTGSGRPLADIAFAAGFDSLSTFNRAFRRTFGAAPSELRATGGQRG